MGALESGDSGNSASLAISADLYSEVFDSATRTVREMGYKVILVDRSNGIIETEPRHAGGLLEPWRLDNPDLVDAAGNTLSNRRRRIRFEFVPAGAAIAQVDTDSVLRGAAVPGSSFAEERFDVQTCSGAIAVVVRVYVEQSFIEGTTPSSYSGSLASTWTNTLNAKPVDAQDDSTRDSARWTPIGRDCAYEKTIETRITESISRVNGTSGQ